ncbi:DUF825 domain-containing protein, partial [Mycobacterium tuberculosis]|nr:DUF825 domain-containing protein [Mycobacterium tuberculosis]
MMASTACSTPSLVRMKEREKQMNNHLLPEEIEEFFGNPARATRSFFSYRLSDFGHALGGVPLLPVLLMVWAT